MSTTSEEKSQAALQFGKAKKCLSLLDSWDLDLISIDLLHSFTRLAFAKALTCASTPSNWPS